MAKRRPLLPVPRPCVLLIDDMEENRQAFEAAFRRDFHVLSTHSPASMWSLLRRNEVHVVIADQRMPGDTGCEVLAKVRTKYPRTRRMLLTAYADMKPLVEAMNKSGATYYIQKPWNTRQVLKAVQSAVADYHKESEDIAHYGRVMQANEQLSNALTARLMAGG